MIQTFYALIALFLVMLFSLNMSRATQDVQHRMIINEVTTPFTAVGSGIIEHIGRTAFDAETDESKITSPTFPIVNDPNDLTSEADVDWGGCTTLTYANPTCDDIDDFDGLTIDHTVSGMPYTATVEVKYVNPMQPDDDSGAQTYAKRVEVEVTSPHLLLNGQPFPVTMARVFTYDRITSL